jgi:hypothetical protein
MFDLLNRTYQYPLEYIIEALAPTSELDFDRLPAEKQNVYRAIQAAHIHGSPDGPWFFIIARSIAQKERFQLLGITDTAMLRPQVFAFSEGEVQVGLIGSEKQAIDATLSSLSKEDKRICPVADRYWNARGGSHTDGGAFIFNLQKDSGGNYRMTCADKFGIPVPMPKQTGSRDFTNEVSASYGPGNDLGARIQHILESGDGLGLFAYLRNLTPGLDFNDFQTACRIIREHAKDTNKTATAIEALTFLNDLRYATGTKKRSHLLHIVRNALDRLFNTLPSIKTIDHDESAFRRIDYDTRAFLRAPKAAETTLVINADGFAPEGDECDAALLVDAYREGWRHFICFGCSGQRYVGCGFGPQTDEVTIDVYGSSGDYLGSGIDGLTITVHNNAQDQLGQIIKSGKMVIYGDVGQTFLYGAKGGETYVMGNAAGRPLINSVGKPRVVINGTCLDFLAESFMAGDPLKGGGFVILNGVQFDDEGSLVSI